MLSIYERRWTPDQATLQVSTRPGYDQCCVLGKTLNTLIMRLFIKELTNRFRETVCETRKNAASLCDKKTSVQNHRSTNSLTHLRAASSSSWGLLVAPMTNILSLGSAMTWKKVKKTKKTPVIQHSDQEFYSETIQVNFWFAFRFNCPKLYFSIVS